MVSDLRQAGDFSQGDIFALERLPVVCGIDGGMPEIEYVDCPNGVMLVNQTCDAIRADYLQVAPLVRLPESDASQSATGKRPRFVPVHLDEGILFADLECMGTVGRSCLEGLGRVASRARSHDGERQIRDLVSRRFGRFPFPDDVVAWFKPLRDKIAPKAKRSGYQGTLLREVTCIRVEDEHNWENSLVYTLSLSFLVSPGTLPLVDDDEDFGCVPSEVAERIEGTKAAERPERIAELIVRATDYRLGAAAVCELWQRLIDCWLSQCDAAYGNLGRPSRVSGKGEVIPEDEYTFDRYRRSEQLDLDYLSRSAGGESGDA